MIHKTNYLFKFGFIYGCLGFCLVCLWDACVSVGYCFYVGELCVCVFILEGLCLCVCFFIMERCESLCFCIVFVCFNNVKTVKEH